MLFCKQMENTTVGILGCGWFGLPFAKALVQLGYQVKGSTTSEDKLRALEELGIEPYLINLNDKGELPAEFFKVDVLFVNVPPKAKSEESSNYPEKLKAVVQAAEGKVQQVVFISSTGVFEDGNFEVDESTTPQPDTAAGKALLAAEDVFSQHNKFVTTIIRFAGLIGPGRNLAKFFAGRNEVPNGKAPVNLIALQDCIGICLALLNTQAFGGIYHAVMPQHPTRNEFYTALCAASGMEKPVFKEELLAWKEINSINVADRLGYTFEVSDWFAWMRTAKL